MSENLPSEEKVKRIDKFWIRFGGFGLGSSHHRVSDRVRFIMVKTFCKMPPEIVDWAWLHLIFVSSSDSFIAFTLPKKVLWGDIEGVIFLSDYFLDEPEKTQSFIIAHEMAHVKLGHKPGCLVGLSPLEEKKQEEEADALAKKWLSKNEGHEETP